MVSLVQKHPSLPCLKGGGPKGRRDSVALGRHAAKAAISPSRLRRQPPLGKGALEHIEIASTEN